MTSAEIATHHQAPADRITTSLWISFAICFIANISAGLISTLMSAFLPSVVTSLSQNVSETDLNNISAYISAIYITGWAIGGFVWGWISDRVGRVRGLIMSIGSLGFFTILISFSPSWEVVVGLRLLSGFAVGGILVLTPTLLSEIWPKATRSIVLGIDSVGFPIGIFSSGLVTVFASEWRTGFYFGIVPCLLTLAAIRLLTESENWRVAKAASGNKVIYSKEDRSNLVTGAVIFSSMLIGLWGMFSWIPTWVQSLLVNSDGQQERGIAMMLLGAGGLLGGFISGWVSNGLGVRKSMMLCFSGCLVVSFVLFGLNKTFSPLIYIELGLLSMFFGISQGLLSIYIPQIFPFHIRGTATGFCFNIGRFVTALAILFVGVLVTTFGGYGNTLLAFAGVFVAGFIAVWFTRET